MKSKKTKKTFSLSLGNIIIGIIIIVAIVMLILYISGRIGNTNSKKEVYESNNSMFTNSELKSVDKNEDYKSNSKIKMKDLNIGELYCGMKLDDMISVLGECNNIYESSLNKDLNYQTYKYDNYNLIIDIDKDTQVIKAISYAGNNFENKKGIKIGSTVADVISAYHSEKNIGTYENNQGTYKVLYNSDDVFDYLYNDAKDGKSLGYMYQYEGGTYAIEYIEKGMKLRFEFLDNKVSLIAMSYK